MQSVQYEIPDIHALKNQPNRDQAQEILERIATHVLPILTQRQFQVQKLYEFFPSNPNLLGMNINRGAKILIRLRPASSPTRFIPYEALLETMLHELTHMVHGPHNSKFYQYLNGLKSQMEQLLISGLVGVEGVKFGMAGTGRQLCNSPHAAGPNFRLGVISSQERMEVARKRQRYFAQLEGQSASGFAVRLGGSTLPNGLHAQMLASSLRTRVLEAAEQRRLDNMHCMVYDEHARTSITAATFDILEFDEDETATLDTNASTNTESHIIDLTNNEDNNDINERDPKRRRAAQQIKISDSTIIYDLTDDN